MRLSRQKHKEERARIKQQRAEMDQKFRSILKQRPKAPRGALTPPKKLDVFIFGEARRWMIRDWPRIIHGKSERAKREYVVRHCLIKYPVPGWMVMRIINALPVKYGDTFTRFLIEIAQGASPYGLYKSWGISRREAHIIMTRVFRADCDWQMITEAKFISRGVDYTSEMLNHEIFRYENWHRSRLNPVFDWLAKNPIPHPEFRGLMDYVQDKLRDPNWSIKGRTLASLSVAMEDWHAALAKKQAGGRNTMYERSGIKPFLYEKKGGDLFCIDEILSYAGLIEEGRRMRHCVSSYSYSVEAKRRSIWSLKHHVCQGEWNIISTKRLLTVEIENATKKIIQARGPCNRTATSEEIALLRRWAAQEGLKVGAYL